VNAIREPFVFCGSEVVLKKNQVANGSRVWLGYLLAIAVTAMAALAHWALPRVLTNAPYLAFYPAIVVAAAYGGAGPGMLATLGSALCMNLLFGTAPGRVDLDNFVVAERLAIFLAGGAGVSLIAHGRRLAMKKAGRLAQQSAELAAIITSSIDAIVTEDPDGTIRTWNPAAETIFGYSATEAMGQPISMLAIPGEEDAVAALLASIHRGERVEHVDARRRRKDGSIVEVSVSLSAVRDDAGRILAITKIARDITERRRAEEAIWGQTELLDVAHDAIMVREIDGTITFWNHGAQEMYGYDKQQAVGSVAHELLHTVFPKPHAEIDADLRNNWRWEGELTHTASDGRVLVVDSRWVLQGKKAGRPGSVLEINNDITERKRVQEEVRASKLSSERAKAAAEEANHAKDRFLAVLSHELRTPLAPLLAGLPMVAKAIGADHPMADTLEMMRRNVELEAMLIDDLLDVTRIAHGKIELNRKPIELGTVIRRAVEVCKPDMEARALHFGVDAKDSPYIVNADAGRLQQVFWNLLKNAIKFTPHGGCVGVRCRRDDGMAVVEVNDSGLGIEPEVLSRIFNAFEQGERSVTRRFGGLGLGLAITKSLVEMHGGSIQAHSEGKGKGATFRVSLPIVTAVPQAEGPSVVPAPPARSLQILLVEDHGDTARIMKRLLKAEGHQVETAGDLATARATAAQGRFDLLISDLGLPDGSGLDLMRQFVGQGKTIPAIALSGYGQDEDIVLSRQAGFAAHLTKPVNMEQLARTIAAVTGPGAGQRLGEDKSA